MPSVSSRITHDVGFLKTYYLKAPTSPRQLQLPSQSLTICWANPTAVWGGMFHRLIQKPSIRALGQQRAPLFAPCPRLKFGCRNTVRFAGANAESEKSRNNEDDGPSELQDDENVSDELDELDSDFDGYDDTTVSELETLDFDF